MKMYLEGDLSDFLNKTSRTIIHEINGETDNYILSVGEEKYIKHLASKYKLECPEFKLDEVHAQIIESEVPANQFPSSFLFWDPNQTLQRDVYIFSIPISGNIKLLGMKPSHWTSNIGLPVRIDDEQNEIAIKVIDFHENPEKLKNEYENQLRLLQTCYPQLSSEIHQFNTGLSTFIRAEFHKKKNKILKINNTLASLGVKVKLNDKNRDTFSIPTPKIKPKISIKPDVKAKEFIPEPSLNLQSYLEILKVINDAGKNFERMPSVYSGKNEEDLRDHILFSIDPHFEFGSASGETFNKSGKTDIQLRYDSSVVFIAECKFWTGISGFMKTIDQMLSYLTWRDSKSALIIFVRNKSMTQVIQAVEKDISNHKHYLKSKTKTDESWLNFIFSLPIDENKEISLAVQLYHIP